MYKFLASIALFTLFIISLNACSAVPVENQQQTTQVEQHSSDNGSEQQQCDRTVVIQNNGKTEVHHSSKC